jgi:hypothetical protein
MNRSLFLVATVVVGIVLGGATGWAASQFLVPMLKPVSKPAQEPTAFLEMPRMLGPIVDQEGRLMGYNQFIVHVEIQTKSDEDLKQWVPLLQDAINMRTFRTPMAVGTDGQRPNLDMLRQMVRAAAEEVLGKKEVRRILITESQPG